MEMFCYLVWSEKSIWLWHNIVFLGTPIDLSSLVFDEKILSQVFYGLLLISSIASVCMSFAAILQSEKMSKIKTFKSSFFLQIFLFIFTKFAVQAYILSIAIKSLMFYVVFHDIHDGGEIFNLYYREICRDLESWRDLAPRYLVVHS